MLTKQSEMQSQVILISSLNKGVLNSYYILSFTLLSCNKNFTTIIVIPFTKKIIYVYNLQ